MHIGSRVSDSVEKNRHQLQRITDRIRLAQARVDKIKGSKKATKVKQRRQLPMLNVEQCLWWSDKRGVYLCL